MNILKRIARFILKEDILEMKIEHLNREKELNEQIQDGCTENIRLCDQVSYLLKLRAHNYLISQEMFEAIIRCLPNPKQVYYGDVTLKDITDKYQTTTAGIKVQVGGISTDEDGNITGVVVDLLADCVTISR